MAVCLTGCCDQCLSLSCRHHRTAWTGLAAGAGRAFLTPSADTGTARLATRADIFPSLTSLSLSLSLSRQHGREVTSAPAHHHHVQREAGGQQSPICDRVASASPGYKLVCGLASVRRSTNSEQSNCTKQDALLRNATRLWTDWLWTVN